MAVLVIDKRLHPRPRRPALPSLLGDGLPERLRSTSIALLGIVAAVGLGIVGFALQLGFPLIARAPLPEPPVKPDAPSERAVVEKRQAKKAAPAPAPAPSARGGASTASGEAGSALVEAAGASPAAPAAPSPAGKGAVLVTGAAPAQTRPQRKQPVDSPPATESPAPEATPPAPPAVEPTATSSETPEPTPEVPEAAAATHSGNGNAYGKGNGKGVGSTVGPPGQATSGQGPGHTGE
jgi:hypothetical protein